MEDNWHFYYSMDHPVQRGTSKIGQRNCSLEAMICLRFFIKNSGWEDALRGVRAFQTMKSKMKLKMSSLFMSINKLASFPFTTAYGSAKSYDFLYRVILASHSAISLWNANTPAQNTPDMEQSPAPWLHTVSSEKKKKRSILYLAPFSYIATMSIHV